MTEKLPAPRLQLRWAPHTANTQWQWECHYELVLPLDKYDVRAEVRKNGRTLRRKLHELVVPIKVPSLRAGKATPCTCPFTGKRYYDDPFRDGAHAQWDALHLGNPPIYVIAPDGMAFKREDKA